MRLIDFFDRGANLAPQRPCLMNEERGLSFTDVSLLTHRIGSGLIANGCEPQSVAAVLSPNDIDAFACILGILRAGCAWMPLNALKQQASSRNSDKSGCCWARCGPVDFLRWCHASPQTSLSCLTGVQA